MKKGVNRLLSGKVWVGITFVLGLVALAVASRTWFETPNFKPIGAVCLLCPLILASYRRWAWMVPLLIVMGSEWCFEPSAGYLVFPLVLSWTISVGIGFGLRGMIRRSWAAPGTRLSVVLAMSWLATLAASLQFFVITNFAVWAGAGWYTPNSVGLWECYAAGLPFFRWTVQSDLC
ncbi:MAG TPA: hypothetical protein PKD54_04745, partial [Pirellulaceae bacterium]|nr:hypothetical protein [Pirellulaceae bacterium]